MSESRSSSTGKGCGCGGIGVGNVVAAILSWCSWHSIGWMIVHLVLGWLYVIYWLIKYWGSVKLSW